MDEEIAVEAYLNNYLLWLMAAQSIHKTTRAKSHHQAFSREYWNYMKWDVRFDEEILRIKVLLRQKVTDDLI
jgi:hypothetical protein